ncbi:tetratricopeptide repeat protein [Campylobacter ureolyticus]|uniref:tetratricopeptide repeat protein n=1 Tax=Campylobacter ureolyticus TaxID=827 RepID=UPI0022B40817|nr:tetratricopeptide repeat protein [Campylobacter ureolyticus]MCZ6167901.1 tetratricopeptide repeat protein [Campylobacter ureolyticus]
MKKIILGILVLVLTSEINANEFEVNNNNTLFGGFDLYNSEISQSDILCNNGDSSACLWIGDGYFFSKVLPLNYSMAAKYYKKAYDISGEPRGLVNLGFIYANGLIDMHKNYEEAFKYYKISCDYRDPNGCYNLATLYRDGLGTEKDTKKAVELFEMACNNRFFKGCSILSSFYSLGLYVEQDYTKSFEYAKKAYDGGDTSVAFIFGAAYCEGEGVEQDYEMAYKYFKESCDIDPSNCVGLGDLYEKGFGVKKDLQKAREYYKISCESNNNDAAGCVGLGFIYLNGKGIRQDDNLALEYFGKACDLGQETGCKQYANLKKLMR